MSGSAELAEALSRTLRLRRALSRVIEPSVERYEAKLGLVRDAVRAYLVAPRYALTPTA